MEESIGLAPNPINWASVLAGRPSTLTGLLSKVGSFCTTTTTKVVPNFTQCFSLMRRSPNGRDDRIWTCDPLVPSEVRYQAALHPEMAPSSGLEPKTLESKSSMLPITLQGIKGSFRTLTATKVSHFFRQCWASVSLHCYRKYGASNKSRTCKTVFLRHVCMPIPSYSHMVGKVGLEPTKRRF